MATYQDLKQAVLTTLNRPILTDFALREIETSIRRYQRDFFHPTPITTSVDSAGDDIVTVAGTALYTIPDNLVTVTFIRLAYGSTWRPLRGPILYESILRWDVNIPSTQSVPNCWARFDQQYRLYPVPDDEYVLELTGTERIPVPADDETENFWTEDARDLIKCATLAELYLGTIKDDAAAQRFKALEEQHRISLVREAMAKTLTGQVQAHW